MSNTDFNALETLARESIHAGDLARGVVGEFEILGGWDTSLSNQDALQEVHDSQRKLVEAGWRRDKAAERLAPFSHNIEVAAYRKQFKPGQPSRWVVVTVATRFGLTAKFKGTKELDW
jgi:hypothetical protein